MSLFALSPIREGGMEDLVRVLPDLQANIRRFLAVRKFEELKVERKKQEVRERKERQKDRMASLAKPRATHIPNPPKVAKGKEESPRPGAQQRAKTPAPRKNLSSAEFRRKYERTSLETPKLPENVVPVEKFDQDMANLMKNINEITLTLNKHDATILPTTAKKAKRENGVTDVGFLNFSAVPFPEVAGKTNKLMRSPPKITTSDVAFSSSPQDIYSEKVRAVLASVEAEYASLAKTNAAIKEALDGAGTGQQGQHIGGSPQKASPNKGGNGNYSSSISPGNFQLTQQALPAISESHAGSNFSVSAESTTSGSGSYTYNSSLVTVDSDAYIPIRRSGDPRLDVLVQEALVRAQNTIHQSAAPTIQEDRAYEGDELQNMLHRVVIQLNNASVDPSEVVRRVSDSSQASGDSVGLDALTRSITAIQAHNRATREHTPSTTSQLTSVSNSVQSHSANVSHENSMDSHQTANSSETNQTTVSELTVAIQDILANLSGGIFERARLEFSDADLKVLKAASPFRNKSEDGTESPVAQRQVAQHQHQHQHQYQLRQDIGDADSASGRITDTIMAQVRSEMKAPADMKIDIPGREEGGSVELLSKTPPLEMSDYLDSVYQRNAAYAAALSSKSSPSKGGGVASVSGVARSVSGVARSVLDSLDYVEGGAPSPGHGQDSEKADLFQLLQHQERSMQLIRDSIQAIERGELPSGLAGGLLPGILTMQHQQQTQEVDDIDPSQSPRKAKSAKGKRKKVKQSQHAAPRNAAELDMLRNLGDYLRREKERVTANKQLSYDELLQKAQTDLGIHHAEVASASKGGGKPSKSKAAAQVRAVAIEDDYEESYREHLRKKFLKEKAATGGSAAVGVGRKLYPITDADGEEDDDGARTVPHRTLETLQYTDSQQRLFERRLALEREIEAYNRSHKQPLPAGSAGTSTGHSTDTGTGNKRDESVTSTARRSSGDEDDDRVGHGSPPRSYKGRFDMSEALLSSPGLSSGEKDVKNKKKLKFSDIPTEYTLPQVYGNNSGRAGGGSGKEGKLRQRATTKASSSHGKAVSSSGGGDRAEWNGRFYAPEEGRRAEDRQSSKQQESDAEVEADDYRASYRIIADEVLMSEARVPEEPTRPAREHSASPKKKRAVKSAKGKRREQQPGDFDEKLISVAEMLNVKAPTSIKSSAAVEASPRRHIARLLHPFK